MRLTLTLDGAAFDILVDHKARTVTVDGERFPLTPNGVRLLGPGRAAVGRYSFTPA